MQEDRILGIARMALSVIRRADRLLAGPSIEKARRAVVDAERRRSLQRVLDELDLGAVAAPPQLEIQGEFTDEIGGVQAPATLPG